jgi:hypothetical protein
MVTIRERSCIRRDETHATLSAEAVSAAANKAREKLGDIKSFDDETHAKWERLMDLEALADAAVSFELHLHFEDGDSMKPATAKIAVSVEDFALIWAHMP